MNSFIKDTRYEKPCQESNFFKTYAVKLDGWKIMLMFLEPVKYKMILRTQF